MDAQFALFQLLGFYEHIEAEDDLDLIKVIEFPNLFVSQRSPSIVP
jgi:hypothetical protein